MNRICLVFMAKFEKAKINYYSIRADTDFIVFLQKIYLDSSNNTLIMKRFAIIASMALMLLGCFGKASAQLLPDVPDLKGKFIFGGNIGGGMSGNYLNVTIAPQVGYRVFNPWELGVRGIYDFTCVFNRTLGNRYGHYFGVAPYTNFQFYKGLFVHVEDEIMYGLVKVNDQKTGQWFNSIFVGGGYRLYNGSKSFMYVMVLYNLSWSAIQSSGWDTPYGSPIALRVGYCF